MKSNSIYIILLSLFSLSPVLQAQEAKNISEIIATGLENNFDLKISRNEQRISDNDVTLGNAGFLPTLGFNSGYNVRQNQSDQFPFEGGDKVSSRDNMTQTLDASINLNMPIFEGFRVQTNYKRLKELQSVGELNTQLDIENFIASISAEYYNYVQQILQMKNIRQAVDLSRERLRIVEARYQIGDFSRLDLQQARVDFNADSSMLIQQYEVVHTSRIKLNEMMGVDNVEQLFVAADTCITYENSLLKDELRSDMMMLNTSLLLTEKNKTLSELDLKTLQSQNYPYLRLNAGYGFTHYDYNSGTIDRQRNWGPTAGVTLGFTIFDGFNRKREQKNARIRIENRELQIDRQKLHLQSDFANMWLAYQNNMELAKLEEESLENAQLNHEIALERYKVGDLSGILLREAQVGLLNAEQRLLNAQYRVKLYEISLMQISGRIGQLVETESK